MKLSNYLSGLLDTFKDSRIVRNVTDLVRDIIANQTIRLWTLSRDKAEFAKYKRLVDGSLKSEVDADSSAAALRERSVAALESASRVILLHDPRDIRKPHAQEMENLGKVRDFTTGHFFEIQGTQRFLREIHRGFSALSPTAGTF